MSYSSILYICIFLPAVILLYGITPQRHRGKILLAASYLFFYMLSGKLLVYLILSTFSIHHIGLWLSSCRREFELEKRQIPQEQREPLKKAYTAKRRKILLFAVLLHVGMLLFLKYFNFFGTNVNHLLQLLSVPIQIPQLKLAVPLGISFYTLQAVSYIVDVYQGKTEADDNIGRLALYMAFFPVIMEGPICRYSQTAPDLYQGKQLAYRNVTFGYQRIVWGLFKKLVIADRLNPLVKTIFENHQDYGGVIVIAGAVLYTFQLYADFSGCIDITIGTGEIFGVKIPENFRQPFFSKTASEFWRRWHITLGTWFKDYIFYPVSLTHFVKNLSKKTKNRFGKHAGQIVTSAFALFGVWFCNGLWHGTGWNYIFFGLYYFVLILLGNIFEPWIQSAADRLHIDRHSRWYSCLQRIKLLLIVFTGELFFRAEGLRAGTDMFRSVFTEFDLSALTDGSLFSLGISRADYLAVLAGFAVVLLVGILHEKGISIRERAARWGIIRRWSFYYGAVLAVVIFGAYGPGYRAVDLIYAGF